MNEVVNKPYEISIWEDILETSSSGQTYYRENKIATIGSNTMTSPNRVFDPILTENLNGEVTFSFSIRRNYFDTVTGELVKNPFIDYLINERKVKLYYNDEWYDFVIKACNESSEDYIFKYDATGLFPLELGKVGYSLDFSTDLNNNQGTIIELAEKVLEPTDWVVDKADCDLLQQTIKEPVYSAVIKTIASDVKIINVGTNEEETFSPEDEILLFYSYVANAKTEFIQFVRKEDAEAAEPDGNNVVTATNYRILNKCEFNEDKTVITVEGGGSIEIGELFNEFQVFRLVYGQLTTVDPVMGRTVDIFKAELPNGYRDIYRYKDTTYLSSNVVTSFVSNGVDFNTFDNGTLEGWSSITPTSLPKVDEKYYCTAPLSLTTYPEISIGKLELTTDASEIRGFLETKFVGAVDKTNGLNTIFNSGIKDNFSTLERVTAGEEFVLRIRYGYAAEQHGDIQPYNETLAGKGIRVLVSRYEEVNEPFYDEEGNEIGNYGYKPTGDVLLDFTGEFTQLNNIISNGSFNSDHTLYLVNNVAQLPSTKYCYKEGEDGDLYIWDSTLKQFKLKTEDTFLNYYVTTARANYSVSEEALSSLDTQIGIFLYTEDETLINKYIYIEDVAITRCYRTGEGDASIITIGNIPTTEAIVSDVFYLKPKTGAKSTEINTYGSLEYLCYELGIDIETVKPIYNENCEKILSIEESQSNCFNILQSLCETFECWLKLKVKHNQDGSLAVDEDGYPYKKVSFKQFIGKDNYAGFKYGINLNSIERTLDSNEIVTKMIVDTVQSDTNETGTISIQNAESNPSKESYILDFAYYINQGLIKNEDNGCYKDLNLFNALLRQENDIILNKGKEKEQLEAAILELQSNIAVYDETVREAKEEHTELLGYFKELTGVSYETFVNEHKTFDDIEDDNSTETILETIGRIYALSIVINNYSGLLTNLKEECKQLILKSRGATSYNFSITTTPARTETQDGTVQIVFDDYIEDCELVLQTDIHEPENNYSIVTGPNNRIFTITIPPSGKFFTKMYVKKAPGGEGNYEIEYYVKNQPVKTGIDGYAYFDIYNPEIESTVVKQFRFVPSEEYELEYKGCDQEIQEARDRKAKTEKIFYNKYSRFIQEGTWSSNDYISADLYYLDALQVSRTSSQPKVTYTIQVSEISQIDETQNYDFRVGDQTYVEDVEFFGTISTAVDGPEGPTIATTPIKEQVVISTAEWHLDKPEDNSITVQNYKTQFEDLFQRINATVQTLQYNELTYPKTSAIVGTNGLIDPELLLKSWNSSGGIGYNLVSNGSITTDNEGILVRDLTNSTNLVKIISRGIKVSSDGGNTWTNVIDGQGINANAIKAGIINTQEVWLMDGESPSFRWDKAGISAYGFGQEDEEYDLKTYVRFDKYGLYGIKNGENYVATSTEDIKENAHFGITWDGFFIKNSYRDGYVSISSNDDFQVVGTNVENTYIMSTNETLTFTTITDDLYIEETNNNDIVETLNSRTITLPYSNLRLIDVRYTATGAIVSEADYTFDGHIINFDITKPDILTNNIYTINYVFPPNSIDIGGSGILKINSIYVDNTFVEPENYVFDRNTGLLTFSIAISEGARIVINYQLENIKIGALEFDDGGAPTKYGMNVKNNAGETVFETNDEGNLTVTGTINATDGVFNGTVYAHDGEFEGHVRATTGEFPGSVIVGDEGDEYILIEGGGEEKPFIASSNYLEDNTTGWIIDAEGDALFNNVSVRGSIKTSVFEQGEIQTVGGAFMFRPSDSIEQAFLKENLDSEETHYDLVITLKQGGYFKVNDWCQLGNYTDNLNSLSAVYRIKEISDDGKEIILENGGDLFVN